MTDDRLPSGPQEEVDGRPGGASLAWGAEQLTAQALLLFLDKRFEGHPFILWLGRAAERISKKHWALYGRMVGRLRVGLPKP